MLELILKLYTTARLGEVRSPVPHLFGPAGCGKSTFVEQAAELLGVQLHVINVSRISPLELEGVQMPDKDHAALNFLTATFWTRMRDGDILLLDEFLRGFPEVYNGLLDILTSRQVGGFRLPNVFIIAASNTTVSYDKALEDRLLHLPVPDLRSKKSERTKVAKVLGEALGLHPDTLTSYEMDKLIDMEIAPMYEVLDLLGAKSAVGATTGKGCSVRNLIGQAKLRHVTSGPLEELIKMNNVRALNQGKHQFVILLDGKNVDARYLSAAPKLVGNRRLTPQQALNLTINLQLIELEDARKEGVTPPDDDDEFF